MNDGFEYAIKDWAEIKDDYENGNLIIGNGASVALHQKFRFDSLKEEAEKLRLFNEDISKLFIEFDTSDFELILRLVWHAKFEPYRVCRRVNILRDYPDDKIKIYP